MIIKKYLDFIGESYEDFDSFGQWVDSLSDDPQILRIVNRYINDDDDLYGGEEETSGEVDYSELTPRELTELIDDALDAGDYERVKMLSQYMKEGKEIYLKELERINESHTNHNRRK